MYHCIPHVMSPSCSCGAMHFNLQPNLKDRPNSLIIARCPNSRGKRMLFGRKGKELALYLYMKICNPSSGTNVVVLDPFG
jgi:hypothetical protein